MYRDPKWPPVASSLSTEDPDAHREAQALADLRAEDAELRASDGSWEWSPVPRQPDEWTLMEWDSQEVEAGWL